MVPHEHYFVLGKFVRFEHSMCVTFLFYIAKARISGSSSRPGAFDTAVQKYIFCRNSYELCDKKLKNMTAHLLTAARSHWLCLFPAL